MNLESLKKVFKGDIETGAMTLEKYSHDASLFEVRPQAVVFPKDSADVQALVKWANSENAKLRVGEKNISITVRSAGTCMAGGAINDGIIMDVTRYMNRLGEVNLETKTIVTEPGVFYRDFEKKTLAKNLMYPAFPASKELCAMGGIVGNNGAGEKTLRYGKAEKYVIATKVVFNDGNEYVVKPLTKIELEAKMAQGDFEGGLYKSLYEMIEKNYEAVKNAKPAVSKNSAGYYLWNVWDSKSQMFDLNKLLVGSQGTLGIVTEATFQLVDVEPCSNVLAIYMNSIERVGDLAKKLVSYNPDSIESFDRYSLRLAFTFFFDFLGSMGVWKFIKLGIQMIPDGIKILRGGIPELIVIVEVTGKTDGEVKEKLLEINKGIASFGYETHLCRSKSEADKYWRIRRESFNLLRKHVQGKRTAPFIDDIIVDPKHLPEFIPKIQKILDDAKFVYTIAGHVGNGNFHIIPLLDMHDATNRELILKVSDQVYDLVLSYSGSITAEHNDGIVRTPYLEKMYGPFIMGLFKFTKSLFDPENIFNPGKKVGDTKEYLKNHIRIEK
jgi:FAD/FMN-containing dehydrogenase